MPTRTAALLALAAGLLLPGVAGAAAQTASAGKEESRPALPNLHIPRATSPIQIDGVLDEPAWQHALEIPLTLEIDPSRNVPAPVTTTAWITYDTERFYAAFRADDPEPSAIRAHMTDRDGAFRDDFVGFFFDTFNDPRRGFEIFINPLGVQMDLAINESGEEDESWDIIFDSAGRIGETGYVVEFAIPFSSLRFQRVSGEQTWGIGAFRAYPRSVRHQLTSMRIETDNNCLLCQLPKVTGFEGVSPGRNIELDPTATAHRTDERQDFPDGEIEPGSTDSEVGLTGRWGITPNLILSGAVNPDFSQVEADVAQFDVNTQFALFYPEKRPFFLEGADFFVTPLDVIHTRTVADPAWGVKLTGKEGKNGIGLFVAQDDTTNLLLPGEQSSDSTVLPRESTDATLRYRRDLGSSSSIGAVLTHRQGDDYTNSVFGADGRWRPTGTDTVSLQALGSRSQYPAGFAAEHGLAPELDGTAVRAAYDHGSRYWTWYARYEDVDPGFRADLGFMPKVGYSTYVGGLEHTWWAKEKDSWYTSFELGGDWDMTRGTHGVTLERELETWVSLNGPLQSNYNIDTGWRDRYWNGVTFDERFTHVHATIRPSGSLSLFFNGTVGDTIDFAHTRPGDLLRITPEVVLNLGRRLSLDLQHDLQKVDVKGGELLELNVSQLRAAYQLNLRTLFRAILQYTDLRYNTDLYTAEPVDPKSEHLFSQLLFAYKLNPQTVLFLGYSDNSLGGELLDSPQPLDLTRSDRTLFLKIGYALLM